MTKYLLSVGRLFWRWRWAVTGGFLIWASLFFLGWLLWTFARMGTEPIVP